MYFCLVASVLAMQNETQPQNEFSKTATQSTSTYFGSYWTGTRIEDPNIIPGCSFFNISMVVTPTARSYGMLASYDRSSYFPQMRLEIYASGKVGLAMDGIPQQDNMPDGDPAGWRSALFSPPLTLHAPNHLSVARFVDGKCYMSINSELVSELACTMANIKNDNRNFRLGSRYGYDRGSDMIDYFVGQIEDAVYTTLGTNSTCERSI